MKFLEVGLLKLISNIFKSGALRTITNITRSKAKRIHSQVYFKGFIHKYRTAF